MRINSLEGRIIIYDDDDDDDKGGDNEYKYINGNR